jgi:hypothetical protein
MHSATTATGRPLPPPGKSLPKNRPAPLSCRPVRQLAAEKSHVTYVTSHRQRYIQAPASTAHSARIASHRKINRQPRRLEFTLSPTKQTPAPQINRQQITTSKITHPNHHNQNAAPAPTRHSSRITRHCRSNRHTPRLENAISRRKQTLGARSNRHFLHVSASHQLPIADAHHRTHNVSNRQWQILEINVNHSKQTTAPRSNRHKNAVVKRPKSPITPATNSSHAPIRAWLAVPVVSDAESVYNLVYWLRDNVRTNQNSEDPAGVAGLTAIVRRRGFRIARASDANQ